MIYINPTGGLVNRMYAIASGVALARSLGCDFRIVWSVDNGLKARFDDLFEVPKVLEGKIITPWAPLYGLLYGAPSLNNLYITALTCRRFGCTLREGEPRFAMLTAGTNREKLLADEIRPVLDRQKDCLIGAGSEFHSFRRDDYRKLFVPRRDIIDEAAGIVRTLGKDYVGLNMRHNNHAESMGHTPVEEFEKQIEAMLAANPDERFFLATDEEAVKGRFRARFGYKVRFNTQRADRTTRKGMREILVELVVLSGSRKVIGPYESSFSEAASLLGECDFSRIYKE